MRLRLQLQDEFTQDNKLGSDFQDLDCPAGPVVVDLPLRLLLLPQVVNQGVQQHLGQGTCRSRRIGTSFENIMTRGANCNLTMEFRIVLFLFLSKSQDFYCNL